MSKSKLTSTNKELVKQLLAVLIRPKIYLGLDYTDRELIAYLQGMCHGYRDFSNNSTVVISTSTKIWEIYDTHKGKDLLIHLTKELKEELDDGV